MMQTFKGFNYFLTKQSIHSMLYSIFKAILYFKKVCMKRLFYHFLGGCESDALFLTLRSRVCKIAIVCKYIFKIPVESKIERRIIKKII